MKRILLSFFGLSLLVLVLSILFLYVVSPSIIIPPKADAIDFPEYGSVEAITVSGEVINADDEVCKTLYEYICKAIPTRKQSVHDAPLNPAYMIDIKIKDQDYPEHGFIYKEGGNVYYEIPYMGIYKLDDDVWELLKA